MSGGGKFGLRQISSIGKLLGYRSTWVDDTTQTLENELRSRGIEPQRPPEDEMPVSKRMVRSTTSHLMLVAIGLVAVAIVAWLIYKIALG
jgi:hypothetical protein